EGEFRIKGYDGPIVECEKCGSEMHLKMGRFGKYEIEEGEFRIKGYDGPIVECEKCGSEMHLKMGRFGKY
ncbi:topoisomerase DNA-binding C4 zinc finger domain-containing protein, partial [Salmonella enterica]